jgi:hypothetical protein
MKSAFLKKAAAALLFTMLVFAVSGILLQYNHRTRNQKTFTVKVMVEPCDVSTVRIYAGSPVSSHNADPLTHGLIFPHATLVTEQAVTHNSSNPSECIKGETVTFFLKTGSYFAYPVPNGSQYPYINLFQPAPFTVIKDVEIDARALIPL